MEHVSGFDLDLDVDLDLDLDSDFALLVTNNDYYTLDCTLASDGEPDTAEPSVLDSALMAEVRAGGQYAITVVRKGGT